MSGRLALVVVAVGTVALAVGYWWGHSGRSPAPASIASSATPVSGEGERKILFYRHPMGLPDTSLVPKKDAMGMDYVPVYAGDAPSGPGFVVPMDKLQRLGVRTIEAAPRELVRRIRAVGTIQVDERRLSSVTPKFDGYIVRLHVATTGAPVKRGDPLLDVYSPELVSAQNEYLLAQRNLTALGGAGPEIHARLSELVDASRARLRNWDIELQDLPGLQQGNAQREVLIRSPVNGVVTEKMARVGQRFMAGETLYQVAGLDRVWLVANVFEQDLATLAPGQSARASFEAYPGRVFEGRVTFVYPTLEADTRTLGVRIELANPGHALKPGLYGTVEFAVPTVRATVAVPESAVLDSGTRQLVFVAYEGGRFEAREVHLGAHADGYVAITHGLEAGQSVVVDGNFLIDAESNLTSGTQSLGHAHGGAADAGRAEESAGATPPTSGHAGH